MTNLFDFTNKRIVILGLARQGAALARFFVDAGARVTVSDSRDEAALREETARLNGLPMDFALGGHPLALLDRCDLLCLSGGVPPQTDFVQAAIARGVPLSNDSLLTLQIARARGLGPTICITGSSGKTTTTTLVGNMLAASGQTVHVGGNVGTPLIDRLADIAPGEPIVLELSSFQLELFDPSLAHGSLTNLGPDVAALLNVTPNHLDRHPSMRAYAEAKLNLLRHLRDDSTVVLSADDGVTAQVAEGGEQAAGRGVPAEWAMNELLNEMYEELAGRHISTVTFSRTRELAHGAWLDGETLRYKGSEICQRDEIKLRGDHNVSNLLAACAIAGALGDKMSATVDAMGEVARSFAGVPHRLETVLASDGVTWVNDSIATSPERAIAGLRSFDHSAQTLILLAGGKDKNLPWDQFVGEVLARVDFLICFGEAGPQIADAVQERAAYSLITAPNSAVVQRLDEAVALAARMALLNATPEQQRGETVVLLSPGGTSYDAYKDFEARGEHFRKLVRRYTEMLSQQNAVQC